MKTKIPDYWYKELLELCPIQSHSKNEVLMVMYLDRWLTKHNLSWTMDNIGNMIVTKGNAKTYPCVVAHLDTVHDFANNPKLFITEKRELFAKSDKKQVGIGGDDKCGILACLYFLKTLPAVKVVFFTKEEAGCQGSNKINKTFFDDCRYIIQLDRKGKSDFIDTRFNQKMVSHNFSSEIGGVKKKYGFKSTTGIHTDCVNLWDDGVDISCVNISSGYYEPHSANEYIKIDELWNSILFTEEIIKTLKPKRYKSIRELKTYNSSQSCNTTIRIYCNQCKTLKPKWSGKVIENKFRCFSCLQSDGKYDMCYMCYKYVLKHDLRYDTVYRKQACSSCRAGVKGKSYLLPSQQTNYKTCDICNIAMDKKYGHDAEDKGVDLNGMGFVCYVCYEDIKEYTDVKTLQTDTFCFSDDKEVCSECKERVDKLDGKQDGELFICNKCLLNTEAELQDKIRGGDEI